MKTTSIVQGCVIVLLVLSLLIVRGVTEGFTGWIRDTELGGAVYSGGTIMDGAVAEPFVEPFASDSLLTSDTKLTNTKLDKVVEMILSSIKDTTDGRVNADKLAMQLNQMGQALESYMNMMPNQERILQSSRQPAMRTKLDVLKSTMPTLTPFVRDRSDAELLFMLMMTLQSNTA